MNEKMKDVAVRAGKTFSQAALAYLLADAALLRDAMLAPVGRQELMASLLVGALAAGLSAVWNGVLQPLTEARHGE